MIGFASAPASSANLGPGFDVLALALSLRCSATAEPSQSMTLTEGASTSRLEDRDIISRAVMAAVDQPMHITLDNEIPRSRGLGSSAAVAAASASRLPLQVRHSRRLDRPTTAPEYSKLSPRSRDMPTTPLQLSSADWSLLLLLVFSVSIFMSPFIRSLVSLPYTSRLRTHEHFFPPTSPVMSLLVHWRGLRFSSKVSQGATRPPSLKPPAMSFTNLREPTCRRSRVISSLLPSLPEHFTPVGLARDQRRLPLPPVRRRAGLSARWREFSEPMVRSLPFPSTPTV